MVRRELRLVIVVGIVVDDDVDVGRGHHAPGRADEALALPETPRTLFSLVKME